MCHMSIVCQWPLQSVLCSGVSLWNHFRRYEEIQEALLATMRSRNGRRKYDYVRVPRKPTQCPRGQTLAETSIRSIVTKYCCAKKCCQLFSRDKIKSLR